jgi:Zn-dependent peptidase ImmA (M78 family)/transcriptional regulator with XRE-family HTH domain
MAATDLGKRLKEMRESLGLSLGEAALRLGYNSYQILANIEQGKREVKASELTNFSNTYFCGLATLLGQDEAHDEKTAFLWRSPPANSVIKREIEAKITHHCRQYRFLEQLLKITQSPKFPEKRIDDIRTSNDIGKVAQEISSLLRLGDRPAFSLQKILEYDCGVKILFYPFREGSAISLVHPEIGYVIIINSDEAPWRRNYDLAHELFHLVTWGATPQKNFDEESCSEEIEKKAEQFASILLLPAAEVEKEIRDRIESQGKITYSDIVDLAQSFGTSIQALCYRLAYLRFIKWESADELAHDEDLLQAGKSERADERNIPPAPERFHSLAIRCLRKGLISRGKFAEITGIKRHEIDAFIADKGLMETEGKKIEIMATGC